MIYQLIFRGTENLKDNSIHVNHLYETDEDLLDQLNNPKRFLDFYGQKRGLGNNTKRRHLINKDSILHVIVISQGNINELLYY